MDENRKGICTNIGNCKNADSKLPIEVPLTADFVCPECESELMEIKRKKKISPKKLIGIIAIVLILSIGGYGFYLYKKAKTVIEVANNTINTASKLITDSSTINTVTSTIPNPLKSESTDNATLNKSSEGTLSANSLAEYFQKIGDASIDYKKKENLKKEIISKYFSNENIIVVEIGANNTEVNHTPIKEYVEELSQLHYKIQVLKSEHAKGTQKITKIFIKEL